MWKWGLAWGMMICLAFSPQSASAWGKKPGKSSLKVPPSPEKILREAQKRLKKARALRDKGKNDLAIAEYVDTLRIDPSLSEGYIELGALYSELGIHEKVVEFLEGGLPVAVQQGYDPQSVGDSYCLLAASYKELGKLEEASGALVKAVECVPNDPRPQKILGDIFVLRTRPEDAFAAYRKSLELDAQNADCWWALGELALKAKKPQAVQEAYHGLLKSDSSRGKEFVRLMEDAHIKPQPPSTAVAASPSPATRSGTEDDPYAAAPSSPPRPPKTRETPREQPSVNTPAGETRSRKIPPGKPAPTNPPPSEDDPYASAGVVERKPPAEPVPPTPSPVVSNPAPDSTEEPVPSAPPDGDAPARTTEAPPTSEPTAETPPPSPVPTSQIYLATSKYVEAEEEASEQALSEIVAMGSQTLPVLEDLLKSPDPDERKKILKVFVALGKTAMNSKSAIEDALSDPDPGVRELAGMALEKLNE